MLQHEVEITKISIVTVILSVILSTVIISVGLVSDPKLLPLKVGIILSLIGFFWWLYEHYLWKISFFKVFGWLSSTPDLSGRWEGLITRDGENEPHEFVLEITQTYSRLKYYVYSRSGKGESISTKFIKDELGGKFHLVSAWKSKVKNKILPDEYDTFRGLSIMDYFERDDEKWLEDIYFTDRNPRTSGITKVKFISSNLKGSL